MQSSQFDMPISYQSAARVEALQAQVDRHVETREGVGEVMEMLHKAVVRSQHSHKQKC